LFQTKELEDGELTRFGDDDNVNEKGNGGKKGKSVATNMTGLFQWSGFVCDATELVMEILTTN
jgi:hypothetical protein